MARRNVDGHDATPPRTRQTVVGISLLARHTHEITDGETSGATAEGEQDGAGDTQGIEVTDMTGMIELDPWEDAKEKV